MKRLLLAITIGMFAAMSYSQQVAVTANKRGGITIARTAFWLNPQYYQYITYSSTLPVIGYADPASLPKLSITEYQVINSYDSMVNMANIATPHIVNLLSLTPVASNRDTAIKIGLPINLFGELKVKAATTNLPSLHATLSVKQNTAVGYTRYNILETPAIIKTRIDSLIRVSKDSTFR